MNLKQALKRKNRLVGLIAEEYKKVSQYNSVDDINQRPYAVKEAIQNWLSLTNELVELKCKSTSAVLALSALNNGNSVSVYFTAGKYYSRWSEDMPLNKVAEIGILERDAMVKGIETQIETIQDELDEWNHVTILP